MESQVSLKRKDLRIDSVTGFCGTDSVHGRDHSEMEQLIMRSNCNYLVMKRKVTFQKCLHMQPHLTNDKKRLGHAKDSSTH